LVETKINLKPTDKLILLGDYIDRGPGSKEVINYIMQLQVSGFDIIPLMGNHEAMLLEVYENKDIIPLWLYNGGAQTLKSFSISNISGIDPVYIEFFRSLPYYYSLNEFLFVHAGFNDKITNPFEDKYTMLWHCSKKYTNALLMDKVIVHGHRPQKAAELTHNIATDRNVINIDTGCVYVDYEGYGKLTAIELNTFTIMSV
jgi:serine/threonine protein phosphatase 1